MRMHLGYSSRRVRWPGYLAVFAVGVAIGLGLSRSTLGGTERRVEPIGSLVVILRLRLRQPSLPIIVESTAYNLDVAQTDNDPTRGRCGRISPLGVQDLRGQWIPIVAVSRDLLRKADCGARVRIMGKEYVVFYTMHERWIRRVDVLLASRGEAIRHGVRNATFEVVP